MNIPDILTNSQPFFMAGLKTLAGIFIYGCIPAMIVYLAIRANTKKIQAIHLKRNAGVWIEVK